MPKFPAVLVTVVNVYAPPMQNRGFKQSIVKWNECYVLPCDREALYKCACSFLKDLRHARGSHKEPIFYLGEGASGVFASCDANILREKMTD